MRKEDYMLEDTWSCFQEKKRRTLDAGKIFARSCKSTGNYRYTYKRNYRYTYKRFLNIKIQHIQPFPSYCNSGNKNVSTSFQNPQ